MRLAANTKFHHPQSTVRTSRTHDRDRRLHQVVEPVNHEPDLGTVMDVDVGDRDYAAGLRQDDAEAALSDRQAGNVEVGAARDDEPAPKAS